MTAPRLILTLILLVLSAQTIFSLLFPRHNKTLSQPELIIIFSGSDARVKAGFDLVPDLSPPNVAISGYTTGQLAGEAKKHHLPVGIGLLSQGISRSTFEDAFNTRQIVLRHRLRSILLVTSSYHMPRAYLLARLMLLGAGVTIQTFSVDDAPFHGGDRGGRYRQVTIFGSEIIKLWGNLAETTYYLLSDRLLLDTPHLFRFSSFIKRKILSPQVHSTSKDFPTTNEGVATILAPVTGSIFTTQQVVGRPSPSINSHWEQLVHAV